jgi:hypothetical protein
MGLFQGTQSKPDRQVKKFGRPAASFTPPREEEEEWD